MDLQGKILGNRYEIIEKIGTGGMATVYRAKCHVLKREVAVKILRDEFTTDNEFIKRFNAEPNSQTQNEFLSELVRSQLFLTVVMSEEMFDEIKKFEAGETITVPVTQIVKGGLVVDAGVRGFVPASMVSDHFIEDFNQYKGQELELKIVEIEPSENRLILSHKEIVQQEREAKKQEVMSQLAAGDVLDGKVARLTNFGAFIDLGGVDGLVHVSEISYERVGKPSDVLKVGEDVKVKVLAVDPEKDRISLSIKQTLPQPWDNIEEKVAEGDVLDGKVKRLTSFGAFVEVFPGVEGLVHISQISHKHIATPNEVLTSGQDVKVKVLNVNGADRRLALSIKALQEKPAADKKEVEVVEEEHVEIPEEDTGFTLGDLVGDDLKNED